MAAALAASLVLGCAESREERIAGEYLVTAAGEDAIRDAYGRFGIKSATRIAKDVFLVVFDADPGLATLDKLRIAQPGIRAVQANQRYRAAPK